MCIRDRSVTPHLSHELAFVYQQGFGHRPTLVQLAHEIFFRYFHIVEEGLAELRLTADEANWRGTDAGVVHIDQQEADAILLLDLRVRAHQAEYPIAFVAGGGPGFAAIDQKVIALVLRLTLQAGQVGAGARF